jgi:hypothetical protein
MARHRYAVQTLDTDLPRQDLGSYRKDGPSSPRPSRNRLTSAWLLLALKLVP